AARWRHSPLRIGETNVRCLSVAPGKANSSQVASPAEVYRSPSAPGSPQPSERYNTAAAQALARPERTAQEARVRGSCSYLAATNFFKLRMRRLRTIGGFGVKPRGPPANVLTDSHDAGRAIECRPRRTANRRPAAEVNRRYPSRPRGPPERWVRKSSAAAA